MREKYSLEYTYNGVICFINIYLKVSNKVNTTNLTNFFLVGDFNKLLVNRRTNI